MFRVTLAQMRRSVPRLVAAGLAIAIGTAFVAATLLAGDVMSRTGRDAVTARYAEADVVATGTVTDADVAAVRALPGVAAAEVMVPVGVELRTAAEDRYQLVLPAMSDERLTPLRISAGRAPAASGEIALPQRAADAFGVAVGDTLTAVWSATGGSDSPQTETVTLVGIASDPHGAWTEAGGAGIALAADAARWNGAESLAAYGGTDVVVAGAPGTSPAALRDEVAAALPAVDVLTRQEAADEQLKQLGEGGDTVLVSVVLGFAAVAMLVAALVIANTFQVLVAQRARTLALLRAVGARRGQLRASVVTEATILGLASSATGLLAGTALAQGMLAVLHRTSIEAPLPATVHVTWQVVVVPLLVGTAVTVLASLVPARAATQVTAIEALRPLDAPTGRAGAGRVRLVLASVLVVVGAVLLAGAVWAPQHYGSATLAPMALAVGVLGGTLSFVGILLAAVFWVPPLVRGAQGLVGRFGPVPRLAAANTTRNPRRTAATSTALLIGVTLVVMMSTGAASAKASMHDALDEHFPVDVTVMPASKGVPGVTLPATLPAEVAAIDGVAQVVTLRSAYVEITFPEGGSAEVVARAISPEDGAHVLRDTATAQALADGTIVLPDLWTDLPATLPVARASGGSGAAVEQVSLHPVTAVGLRDALVTPATMDRLSPDAPTDSMFVSLEPGADPAAVLQQVQDTLGSAELTVSGQGAQRAQYDRIIGVLLAVVVGLLGVAVLIALLGVTNTLSLSVIERRRESATLRAIGLSRRGLRGTLAIEGVLIAGVGAVLGSVFGLLYGWAGAAAVLGGLGTLELAVPWRDLGLVLVVALGAGLLASVVPARSAARTPPVAALAEE